MTLAIDFGTCNTVLARWQPTSRSVQTLHIGAPTRTYVYRLPTMNSYQVASVIPSIIHYDADQTITIGAQVENTGLTEARGTFRWMKPDLLKNNNRARRIEGQLITPRQAAAKFIQQILALPELQNEKDLVVTVPVEAYDHYVEWLQVAILHSFHGHVRILDEATACILGYGGKVRDGLTYMIFDFGGGTLDVSIIKTFDIEADLAKPCMVLGRAGEEIGGTFIDEWMLQELQQATGISDQDLGDMGLDMLHALERAKVQLSSGRERVEILQYNDSTAKRIQHVFTQADLHRILNIERASLGKRSLYHLIAITVERAIEQAQKNYGVHKSEISNVFMVGGSSLLLGISDLVKYLLPNCSIHCDNPFEAIARGACRYSGGDINLTLVHDYCLRAWDPERAEYVLIPIVFKGTRYPTDNPVSVKYINGACEGSTSLGLIIIERSDMVRPEGMWEVIDGRLQRRKLDWNDADDSLHELNPADREFIHANPPCTFGTRRFVASFGVNEDKKLTISLRDLAKDGHSWVQLNDGTRINLPVTNLPFVHL
jgi:molecular chaperone DnaK (HSP70)